MTDSALFTVISTVGDDVFATTDLTSLIDPTGTSTQHYGPYPSGSTDSGTCGPDWANDTFDRHFTVHTSQDGSITVVEQFKNGTFTTSGPASPGACETDSNHGSLIRAGVTGSMHGYLVIPLPPLTTQSSFSPYCDTVSNADCTTTKFIDTHFNPPCYGTGACSAATFFFHYAAGDQSLLYHEWKNASMDRGGNSGDIADS